MLYDISECGISPEMAVFVFAADLSFTDESTRTGGSSNADDDDQYGESSKTVFAEYRPI